MKGYAQIFDQADLGIDHMFWQAVGRNTIAQHPARGVHGFENFYRMTATAQEIGGGKARRASANHRDPLAGFRRNRGAVGLAGSKIHIRSGLF